MSQQEIGRLRSNYLERYLDLLVEAMKTFWRKKLLPMEYEMLRTRYALAGKPPSKKRSLAKMYDLSEEQIGRLRMRALRRLRYQSRIAEFEELVVETAGKVLALE